jgi:hypothetical protein
MTAPPLPTFVPQTAWYNLTVGQINPSEADSVPNASYLQPQTLPTGTLTGLVGSSNGDLIYLAGLVTLLDGGQKWLAWVADSLQTPDNVNVFCPFPSTSTPGRWVNTAAPASPGASVFLQTSLGAGGTYNLVGVTNPLVYIFIKPAISAPTTINMPGSPFPGQRYTFKDAAGIAGTYPITIQAASIDGETSYQLVANYAAITLTWNGSAWSVG